jgi:hypothetical protein
MRFKLKTANDNMFGVFEGGVRVLDAQSERALSYNGYSVRLRNFADTPAQIYYDVGGAGVLQSTLEPGEEHCINGYLGQKFFFAKEGSGGSVEERLMNVSVLGDEVIYMLTPPAGSEAHMKVLLIDCTINWQTVLC